MAAGGVSFPVERGGVGGRPVDGRSGGSLATGAGGSRGFRNILEYLTCVTLVFCKDRL